LKEEKEKNLKAEDEILNLGCINGAEKNMTANELAAKGIHVSIRSQLVKYI